MIALPGTVNRGFRTGGKIFLSCSGDVFCLLRVDCLNCRLSDQRQDINYFYVSVLVAYNESKLRDAFL